MRDVEIIENGFIAVKDGIFIAVGNDTYQPYIGKHTRVVDGSGQVVTPGLIDSHTHLVHGGSREHELEMKLRGVPYMDILKGGGGILSTVKDTREASFETLFNKAKHSLDIMLTYGVTSMEGKSGYGLNLETEIKQLEVAKALNEIHPVDIVSTFIGAHAVPVDMDKENYIDEVIKMLPIIKEKNLAEYCDVFCEEGVFSIEETRRIMLAAKELGFKLKLHADEMVALGGATLACELGCVSADHLMASKEQDYKNLASHPIVANLLPATSFNLDKAYANARKMIDMGCAVSLSSDYNPGSSPSENIQFVMQLGSLKLKMLPKEVLTAVTINAACSINQEAVKGSIEVGKQADFVLFQAPNIDYLMYHFGVNHVKDVYKNGVLVVANQKLIY